MLAVPSFPAKTIPKLIAYTKANRGKVNVPSPGVGSISHLGRVFHRLASVLDRVHQDRQAARASGHQHEARGSPPGRFDGG
jgi:hypothetical protein